MSAKNGSAYSAIAIDVGNTSTTLALYRSEGHEVEAIHAIRGGISAARGECAVAIRKIVAAADARGEKIDAAMISSVTPSVNDSWTRLVHEEAGLELGFVRHDIDLPFTIDFPDPESIGGDLLADMAAATLIHGRPAMIIDIGTATTYEILTERNSFLTGIIGPGPDILARSLHDYTALLPMVEWWKKTPVEVPTNTEESMLYGIDAGFCGMLRETITRLMPIVGKNAKLIATGGFAERFIPQLGMDFIIDRNLTLRGIGCLAANKR